LKNMQGQEVGTVELPDDIFNIEPNQAVMHQALVRQLANKRLGTHKTKTRGQQEHRNDEHGVVLQPLQLDGLGNGVQVGATHNPVGEGNAVQQDPRYEDSHQEVLQGRLAALLVEPHEARQHVNGEGHCLQTHVLILSVQSTKLSKAA